MLYKTEWNALERRWRLLIAYTECVDKVLNSYDETVDKVAALRLVTLALHLDDEETPMNMINLIRGELHLTNQLPTYDELVQMVGEE